MLKKLANVVSLIFHPLIMPTAGLLIVFSSGSYISLLPYEVKKIISVVVFINTLALPLLLLPIFQRLGVIQSFQMQDKRERVIPLAITAIPYLFSFYFLKRLPIPEIIATFILGATIAIAIALLASIFWKISIHMVGIGGIFGLIFAYSLRFQVDVLIFLIVLAFISGLVAWARLELNFHKPSQVYVGFLTGCFAVALSIVFL